MIVYLALFIVFIIALTVFWCIGQSKREKMIKELLVNKGQESTIDQNSSA